MTNRAYIPLKGLKSVGISTEKGSYREPSSAYKSQAERAGFEPARALALRVFETRALDQTMRPLHG
jgi:hypothetical protein